MFEFKIPGPFILIAGDIHSGASAFRKLIEISKQESCVAFLFTGDLNLQNTTIRRLVKDMACRFIHVQGNHDSALNWDKYNLENPPLFRELEFQGIRIFISHGYVLDTPEHYRKNSNDYDLVISGHTHKAKLETKGKTLFLNPGSAACPIDENDPATYAILDMNNRIVELKEIWTDETLQKESLPSK